MGRDLFLRESHQPEVRAVVRELRLLGEPLAELSNPATPEKAGVQKSFKKQDSGFRRNDARGLLQEPLWDVYGHPARWCGT